MASDPSTSAAATHRYTQNVHSTVGPLKQIPGSSAHEDHSPQTLYPVEERNDLDPPIKEELREDGGWGEQNIKVHKSRPHDRQELFEDTADFQDGVKRLIRDSPRCEAVTECCCSPSSDSADTEEEVEITYTSESILLKISSSSSCDESPLQCAQKLYSSEGSDPVSLPDEEGSNSDSPKQEEIIQSEANITSNVRALEPQFHFDGSRFSYEYLPPSNEMIDAVNNMRCPDELTRWARQYLSNLEPYNIVPVKRKKLE
ncbi:uncharacterized protein LOC128649185 [Bombina bombina]|uniref:uncharacterized protein LOC128649185 n=1 Tax=Bombina bombina TaxID=8345 RepID=UPI00235B2DC9|nr:uncharacterized protein LOC128649185 [Bombina bombina]